MGLGYIGEMPGMYYGIFELLTVSQSCESHTNVSADEEKRRYSKIQATGAAPATSAYSSHDVKRRKLIDEKIQAIEQEAFRQKGRIRKSILDPLTGGILRREYGNGNRSLDGPQIYADGLAFEGRTNDGPPFSPIFAVQTLLDLDLMKAQNRGPGPMIDLHTCKPFLSYQRYIF
jgi:hypothetical protein